MANSLEEEEGKIMTQQYDFGQFGPEHFENIKEGIRLFNKEKFWECHEILEDHWLEARGDNARNVYWAVIQVAAANIHVRDNNLIGAQGLIKKAKEKLDRCEKFKVETSLLQQLDWNNLKRIVRAIPEESQLEHFEDIYKFKFPPIYEG